MGYSVLVWKGDDFPDSRRIQPFAPSEWETYPFADREKLRWFREAKLGLFLTVGLSALGKADLSWSRKTHGFPDPDYAPVIRMRDPVTVPAEGINAE